MYGVRILGPIVIGMSDVPAWRFIAFNAIGAAIWAASVTTLGFLFGQALQLLLAEAEQYEAAALALILGIGLLLGLAALADRKQEMISVDGLRVGRVGWRFGDLGFPGQKGPQEVRSASHRCCRHSTWGELKRPARLIGYSGSGWLGSRP